MKKTNNIEKKQVPSLKISVSNPTKFRKAFLKNGWVVLTRGGQWYTVEKIHGYGTAFIDRQKNIVRPATQWKSDLKSKADSADDIILVAQPSDMQMYIESSFNKYIVVYDANKDAAKKPAETKTVAETLKSKNTNAM